MKHGHHRLRIGRVSRANQIYLVTFCTHLRIPIFARKEIAETAVTTLLDPTHWVHAGLLTWVLMPDHWHGLIELEGEQPLPVLIGRLKGASAHTIGRHHPEAKPIWQAAFHDRALRSSDALPEVARYIVGNPIRAGLADSLADYPYWGSRWRQEFLNSSRPEGA